MLYNLTVADNHNYFADGILVKNCHSAKSYSIQTLGKKCLNADFRIGFTGTLFKEQSDNWNIESVLGPKIFDIGSKELIDRDILSKIIIVNVLIKYKQHQMKHIVNLNNEIKSIERTIRQLKRKGLEENKEEIEIQKEHKSRLKQALFREESKLIVEKESRNKVFDWVFSHTNNNDNTLILVQKMDHLRSVEKYLLDTLDDKYQIATIHGKVKTEEREAIRQLMRKQKNFVLVATYGTMKQGVNIPNIHNVILASPMKSEVTIPQAIGRGLRKAKGKTKVVIWDLVDDMRSVGRQNYLFKQFLERLKLYTDAGFKYLSKSFDLQDLGVGNDKEMCLW